MKKIIRFIKKTFQNFLDEQSDRHYQDGFEFAMSSFYLYGMTIEEITETLTKKFDSFDMGILRGIRIINKNEIEI